MRITIGGALFMAGAGALGVIAPMKLINGSAVTDQVGGLKQTVSWVQSYFKSGGPVETTPINLPTTDKPVEVAPAAVEAPPKQPESVEPVAATAVESAAIAPVETAVVAPVAPAPRVRRRRKSRRAAAPAAKVAAKAKSGGDDKLNGTYVSVQLKSGREVKGIYQGKTATQYTIELPGMGPFQYPVENVVSIKPAE